MEGSSRTSTMVANPSADPASLRAAALSTLRSKRRKPTLEVPTTVPVRPPPPTEMFQLDYGQEETSPDISMADTSPPFAPAAGKKKDKMSTTTEQATSREEGEISEEEEPPPVRKPPTPPRKSPIQVQPSMPDSSSVFDETMPYRPTPPPLKSKIPEIRAPALVDRISDPLPHASSSGAQIQHVRTQRPDDFENLPSTYSIGPDCVRPGLSLTQEEYDTLKDIILDLLGWGVPPAALVECGLSKEAIYYVFYELSLTLPEGFDTSGIAHYVPETLSNIQHSNQMPPPPLPEKRRDSIELGSHTLDLSTRIGSPSLEPSSISSMFADGLLNTDLHDKERQTRQLLMARKAAQASRRVKHSASLDSYTSSASSIAREEVSMMPTAPTEVVEDFLNSLGPVPSLATRTEGLTPLQAATEMEDDDNAQYARYSEERPKAIQGSEAQSIPPSFPIVVDSLPTSIEAPAPLTEVPPKSGSSAPALSQNSESELVTPSIAQIMTAQPNPSLGTRRGVKRPVAADFVDFDPTPRKAEINARNDRAYDSAYLPQSRHSRTPFANVGSRRCVIDLSDSEDEDDPRPQQPVPEEQPWQNLKRDRRVKAVPSSAPVKPATPVMSPGVLMQKELEIQKMRELIARREEETRLKKLAQAKVAAANAEAARVLTSIAQPVAARVKEEEFDVDMSSELDAEAESFRAQVIARRSSESATPPGEVSEASLPVTRSVSRSPIVSNGTPVPSDVKPVQTVVNQDLAIKARNTQVKAALSERLHELERLNAAKMDGLVDADMNPSSSAQMNKSLPITSIIQKQDAKKPEQLEPSNQQHLNNDQQSQDSVSDNNSATFSGYRSPFDSYPLLRSHEFSSSSSHTYSSGQLSAFSPSDSSTFAEPYSSTSLHSLSTFRPDLKPLRLAALSRRLDPMKQLCRYEVPGGGTCRDDGCEDVHLSRLEGTNQMGVVEPSDQETADYLFSVMPDNWRSTYQVDSPSRLLEALQQARHRTANDPMDLKDRVVQALTLIGP